jgi:hypothetical protein
MNTPTVWGKAQTLFGWVLEYSLTPAEKRVRVSGWQ